MNKNLLKVLLCVLFLFLLDRGIGYCLRYLYFKPLTGKFHDLTYAMDSTRADVVIIGSSRASHSYVSQQLEDSLGLSVYNAGMEGAKFFHQYSTLRAIVDRYQPKIIIWDYWEGLPYTELNYMELNTLTPYYFNHKSTKELIDEVNPYEKYKMMCRIYPFNSTFIYNVNRASGLYKNDEKNNSVKGWIPLKRTWTEKLTTADSAGVGLPLDSNCIKLYEKAIAYCKQHNIKLYMVQSPFFVSYKHPTYYDVVAKNIASKGKITFLDFFNDSTALSSPRYFAEPKHLNEEGAHLFTAKLASAIKERQKPVAIPLPKT